MVFSSLAFLLYFFPCLLICYFIVPRRFRGTRNLILFLFSLIFYLYGGAKYLPLLLSSVMINYIGGLFVSEWRLKWLRNIAAFLTVVANLALLGWFKYAGFFAQVINDFGGHLAVPNIVLPIGISFYTFQGLSYLVDVYRGHAKVQTNLLNVALYVVLFPQLVAGPIVRYTTVEEEIVGRRENMDDFSDGLVRFMLGLGKKMLLANTMGEVADAIFELAPADMSTTLAWVGAVAYMLQIYFDFSAYSDMAIGLGRIFGFHFLENFNYPYISTSITEFWRRWHISLSTWFRDYVYIPLGGNRCAKWKHLRNIAVVWLLTGLWHGAAWNFVAWGAWFGMLLIGEKYIWGLFLKRLPHLVGWLYTFVAVIFSWVLFRSPSIEYALSYIGVMIGLGSNGLWCIDTAFYLCQYGIFFLMAVIGAVPIKIFLQNVLTRYSNRMICRFILDWAPKVLALCVLALSFIKLATGSFNPFIYFQF